MDDCGVTPVIGAPSCRILWERHGRLVTITSVTIEASPPPAWRLSLPLARRADEDR